MSQKEKRITHEYLNIHAKYSRRMEISSLDIMADQKSG